MNKRTIYRIVAFALVVGIQPTHAAENNLAEDPFSLELAKHQSASVDKPWVGRSPEELRVWAKKNLHHKVTAKKVIDAEAHPEWDWFRKSGLGLFLHWGLPSANPDTGGDVVGE